MKIGILKADSVMPALQEQHGDYSDMFTSLFLTVDPRCEIAIYEVEHGQYPADIDDCNGYLITGSKRSVYEDEAWIQALGEFVQRLHELKKPLVGICFGHQLVAQYLGGKTEKSDKGWGVGRHETRLCGARITAAGTATRFALLSSHQDQVTHLPDDAEIIAESDFCPIAGMQIADHILTFQGHPEFEGRYINALIEYKKNDLTDNEYISAKRSKACPEDSKILRKVILDFVLGVTKT